MAEADHQTTEQDDSSGGRLIFGRAGLIGAATVLALTTWWGPASLALMASAWLMVGLVCRLWSRLALTRLTCQRRLSRTRAFPGETVELTVTVDNAKLLPLTWLVFEDRLDPELKTLIHALPDDGDMPDRLRLQTALGWYARLDWSRSMEVRRRGWFRLGPAWITSGDPFGLLPRSRKAAPAGELIVYPQLMDLDRNLLPARHALGEEPSPFSLHRDPVLTVGLNRYGPGTPFNHIHWKASARSRELLVRVFEPASRLEVLLLLDGSGFEPGGKDFETAVSLTASLAQLLIDQGRPVGLATNAPFRGGPGLTSIGQGSGDSQLMTILETLAGVESDPGSAEVELFRSGAAQAPPGAALVVIASPLTPGLEAGLDELARRGRRPRLIFVDGGRIAEANGREAA